MKALLLQKPVTTLIIQPLGSNPLRVVSHKHISEVLAIVDPVLGLLANIIAGQRLHNGLEAWLMEVSKGEPLSEIEPDFVGG